VEAGLITPDANSANAKQMNKLKSKTTDEAESTNSDAAAEEERKEKARKKREKVNCFVRLDSSILLTLLFDSCRRSSEESLKNCKAGK
jgi:hypothetical protein